MGFRFQEWPVYQAARQFRLDVIRDIVGKIPRGGRYELISQILRALISIVLNIAEGSFRKTDKDFAHFLNLSLTSLYEVVATFDLAYDDGHIDQATLETYVDKAQKLAQQIQAFCNHVLKSSHQSM